MSERIAATGRGAFKFLFEFANKLTRQHKLLVAFDGLVLSEAVGRAVTLGKIMHGDSRATLKMKIPAFAGEVRKRIKEITALLAGSPPGLVLKQLRGLIKCFPAKISGVRRSRRDTCGLLSMMNLPAAITTISARTR